MMRHITETVLTWIKSNPFTNKFYGIKSRNDGSFLAFNHAWFEKYQVFLLIALNMPVIGLFVRYIFRLPCNFIEIKEKLLFTYITANPLIKKYEIYIKYLSFTYLMPICKITPSNVTYLTGRNKRVLVAYTHVKFSKKVYFSLRWFWWALHYIDEALNYFSIPEQVSFGFATLTAYPATGSNSPIDGTLGAGNYNNNSFSTLMGMSGSYSSATASYGAPNGITQSCVQASSTTNTFYFNYRYLCCFDTSSIGGGGTVTKCGLSVTANYGGSTGTRETNMHIVETNPTSTAALQNSDYGTFVKTDLGYIASSTWGTGQRKSITMNSAGIAKINKSGISKFGLITGFDLTESFTGTWANSANYGLYSFYQADATGDANDPYLYIEYSTSSIKSHIGTAAASVKSHIGTASADIKKHIGTT